MKLEQQFVLNMVSSALHNEQLDWKEKYENLDWEDVIQIIVRNSVSTIAMSGDFEDSRYHFLTNSPIINTNAYKSIYKSENHVYIWNKIKDKCEKASIYVLPLKGVVIRDYYPDPNFREMGDLDILYKGDKNKLKEIMEELGSTKYEAGMKHDHYFFENGIHVEMHRDLVDAITDYNDYFKNIWDKATPENGFKYVHELNINDQYIFVFVHMKEHLVDREFMFKMAMDIYLLNQAGILDREYVEQELKIINLFELEKNILQVVNAWFNKQEISEDSELYALSELLMNSGQYETDHYVESAAYKSGGNKYKYYQRRFFPSLGQMESYYDWLEKAPLLLPVAWGMRIVSAAVYRRGNVQKTFERAKQIDSGVFDQADQYRSILEKYGIKK